MGCHWWWGVEGGDWPPQDRTHPPPHTHTPHTRASAHLGLQPLLPYPAAVHLQLVTRPLDQQLAPPAPLLRHALGHLRACVGRGCRGWEERGGGAGGWKRGAGGDVKRAGGWVGAGGRASQDARAPRTCAHGHTRAPSHDLGDCALLLLITQIELPVLQGPGGMDGRVGGWGGVGGRGQGSKCARARPPAPPLPGGPCSPVPGRKAILLRRPGIGRGGGGRGGGGGRVLGRRACVCWRCGAGARCVHAHTHTPSSRTPPPRSHAVLAVHAVQPAAGGTHEVVLVDRPLHVGVRVSECVCVSGGSVWVYGCVCVGGGGGACGRGEWQQHQQQRKQASTRTLERRAPACNARNARAPALACPRSQAWMGRTGSCCRSACLHVRVCGLCVCGGGMRGRGSQAWMGSMWGGRQHARRQGVAGAGG